MIQTDLCIGQLECSDRLCPTDDWILPAGALRALILEDISEMTELDFQQAWLLKICRDFLDNTPPLKHIRLGMPSAQGLACIEHTCLAYVSLRSLALLCGTCCCNYLTQFILLLQQHAAAARLLQTINCHDCASLSMTAFDQAFLTLPSCRSNSRNTHLVMEYQIMPNCFSQRKVTEFAHACSTLDRIM